MNGLPDDAIEEERAQRARLTNIRQALLAPSGAIVGYSEILHEQIAAEGPEELLPDMDRIMEATRNLYTGVDKLLAGDAVQDLFHGGDPELVQKRLRHDLRTPINGIKGYSEMMLEDLEDFDAERLRGDIDRLLLETNSLLSELGKIIDFSGTGTGSVGDQLEMLDDSMVSNLLKSIKPVAPEPLKPEETGLILVVDDLESNRDVLTRRLEREGHHTASAENGEIALEMLRQREFDLVLLDLMMPGMNGFEVLAHMKEDEALKGLPVIMVSAFDETDSVVRCIEAGADDYLAKPVNPVLLRARIKSGLEKKAWQDEERRQKQFIRRAFSRYISPEVVDELVDNPEKLSLGGERLDITCVFTDLAGFTTLMEDSDPAVVLPVLNGYLDGMCSIVRDHGGTIDKIVGDALHVFFGVPIKIPDHAEQAVKCALDMDSYARSFEQSEAAQEVKFGGTRIGVHSGLAVVGNFGGETFFDYTAHGDTVNTAARMESVNAHLGTRICVSGETANACKSVTFRPIGALVLKGKSLPVEAFEPLDGQPGIAQDDYIPVFNMLKAEDPKAGPVLDALCQSYPDDLLLRFHAERLKNGDTGTTIVLAEK